MTRSARVALLYLGTAGSFGGRRRVASMTALFEAAGATVLPVPLMENHRAGPRDVLGGGSFAVLDGGSVPEALAWSRRSVLAELHRFGPDVVVCSTARSFHPRLLDGPWTMVVDYVDRLSDSYRDRARIVGRRPIALAYRALAVAARRFEKRPLPDGAIGVAAGADDARTMGLTWVPITVDPPEAVPTAGATHDLLFLGKLSYPPNVEAIERLADLWPQIQARRPGTTLLLAGAAPEPSLLSTADRLGWTVAADFENLTDVVSSARISVAPLRHASGIQIKVLDTASYGLAQVFTPTVAKGFDEKFPALVAASDAELVDGLVHLLDDPDTCAAQGRAARDHVLDQYSLPRWVPWARATLAGSPAGSA